MGAFLLLRGDAQVVQSDKGLKCFERQGFSAPKAVETRDWTLYLYGKYAGNTRIAFFQQGNDFAAYTGTLIYAGTTGGNALGAILRDFRVGSVDWEKIYGSYCLIVYENQRLHLCRDSLGLYKVFTNDAGTVISSSFIAVLEAIARPTVNVQSVYEYVFQGATYDDRTIFDQIRLVKRGLNARIDQAIHIMDPPGSLWGGARWAGAEEHTALALGALHCEFEAIVEAFGNNIDTALSGGYDSRLLLALLRARGVTPRVHVYGNERDSDVIIAKSIAASEGFEIEHVDKGRRLGMGLEQFPAIIARNFAFFDGYPADGIFDNGADLESRLDRARDGAIALNGGGGEIFRNFFYLADRPFSIRQVLWTFFCQFDPSACTDVFSEREYLSNMAKAISRLLDLPDGDPQGKVELSRIQVEYLYPCLRCAYWMGRNNSVNNRFGCATTPFVEPSLIRLALQIPISFKNHGRFEAGLIRGAELNLARYNSAYGHNFLGEPPLKRKLSDFATLLRPAYVRKLTHRLRGKVDRGKANPLFKEDRLKQVIDVSFPEMRRYFQVAKIPQHSELKRILTLEYLFEKYQPNHVP